MKQLETIRYHLNLAIAKLNELELALEHRAAAVYEWDAATIAECAAEQFGLAKQMLYVTHRGRPAVYSRQVAMYLMTKHTTMVPKEIAAHFRADMHVGTVRHALESVKDMQELDADFAGKVVRAETNYLIKKSQRTNNE